MTEKTVNPFVKLGLELGPVVLFFVFYGRIKDEFFTIGGVEYAGFIVATALFIPLILASTAILWWLTGKLSKMQLMTAVLIVVFGGMSVYFNDERFFKMKPTMIYLLFGGILGIGLLQGKSYLRSVMEEVLPMQDEGWMILTKRLTAFFAALAITNEFVWRTMSTDAWVNFKTFGLTAAVFVFFMFQNKLMQTYAVTVEDQDT
ncbi:MULTISPECIES: inner membrane-spanning protein YciB [Falsihalocynthiibacter]|uniref:Inner membrane-spanning protein YciB n=1 Tax=Falsihalocynthiibacter arcticus TaxID=1579316 RepID=A0A126UW22_9RHOB|nr:inner membrane-spanning protein YciB [Falsihalocynthiibacter arcticus]AML49925.1 Intracellular septation protein A [Falsihalocynthiibacter arcticus]